MADERLVTTPDGTVHHFPSEATDAQISAALKAIPASNAKEAPKANTWTDLAVNALPAAGATLGGIVGGVGGTAFGLGVGGVPGSIAGATVGGAAGEAARQLVNRARGAEAPMSSSDAAKSIGLEGAKMGAIDAVGGGLLAGAKAISPAAKPLLAKGADLAANAVESPLKSAAGVLRMFADSLKDAPPVTKLALSSKDVTVIQQLKALGVSEGEAVRQVVNTKARILLRGVKP